MMCNFSPVDYHLVLTVIVLLLATTGLHIANISAVVFDHTTLQTLLEQLVTLGIPLANNIM